MQRIARPSHFRGFTLIELMVTVAIVAIMATLAAPSFRDFIVRRNLESVTSEFTAGVARARSESVSKNICTTMCMSSSSGADSPACTTNEADWQVGWIVFLNPACDSSLTAPPSSSDLLVARVAKTGDYYLQAQGSSPVKKMMFNPRGSPNLTAAGEFDAIYRSASHALTVAYGKNICVDGLGRTRAIPSSSTCATYK